MARTVSGGVDPVAAPAPSQREAFVAQDALAQRQLPRGQGSVFSFTLAGGEADAAAFVDAVELFSRMTHLGDVRSLVLHPASTTHAGRTPAERDAAGICPGLLRLSVGIEDLGDLLRDLERGFAAVALSGEQPVADKASVRICGADAGRLRAGARRKLGLGFVPEERLGRGAVPRMSLASNALLTGWRRRMLQHGLIRRGEVRAFAAKIIETFNVKCGGPEAQARSLSGGNLQKFIVGREIELGPGDSASFVSGEGGHRHVNLVDDVARMVIVIRRNRPAG